MPEQLAAKANLEVLRGDFKALNGKVNLILAFNTPLVLAALAAVLCRAGAGLTRAAVLPACPTFPTAGRRCERAGRSKSAPHPS